jgi:hypothetical protein
MCGARPSRQAGICARRHRVSAVENTIGFLFCIFSLRTTLFSAAGMLPGRWFEAVPFAAKRREVKFGVGFCQKPCKDAANRLGAVGAHRRSARQRACGRTNKINK